MGGALLEVQNGENSGYALLLGCRTVNDGVRVTIQQMRFETPLFINKHLYAMIYLIIIFNQELN